MGYFVSTLRADTVTPGAQAATAAHAPSPAGSVLTSTSPSRSLSSGCHDFHLHFLPALAVKFVQVQARITWS